MLKVRGLSIKPRSSTICIDLSMHVHVVKDYCKTLNISVPLMLAKLAMRYNSLTFVVAKINVYCYACAVVCHVVSKVENGVRPPCAAGCRKTVIPFAAKL